MVIAADGGVHAAAGKNIAVQQARLGADIHMFENDDAARPSGGGWWWGASLAHMKASAPPEGIWATLG